MNRTRAFEFYNHKNHLSAPKGGPNDGHWGEGGLKEGEISISTSFFRLEKLVDSRLLDLDQACKARSGGYNLFGSGRHSLPPIQGVSISYPDLLLKDRRN